MRQPIQVAIYCARRSGEGWQFLMLHRIPKNFPIWQGVTGGVEDDETPLVAARREFAEETGLIPVFFVDVDFTYTFPLADRWRAKYSWEVDEITEHVFVAVVDGAPEPVISAHEHDEFRWCTLEEALDLMYWESNKDSLRHCAELLNARLPRS